jgi:hypothetical protein
VDQLGPQVLDQLAHGIGDGLDALELKDFLVYPLDLVGHNDPTFENPRLIGSSLFRHPRRQLFANAAIAASRVAA